MGMIGVFRYKKGASRNYYSELRRKAVLNGGEIQSIHRRTKELDRGGTGPFSGIDRLVADYFKSQAKAASGHKAG